MDYYEKQLDIQIKINKLQEEEDKLFHKINEVREKISKFELESEILQIRN